MKYLTVLLMLLAGNCQASTFLLAGDSIHIGYFPYVTTPGTEINIACPYLTDKTADGNNTGNSARLAACITLMLSVKHYDYVFFNAGMHDVHVKGCLNGETDKQVPLSDYLMNLQTIIDAIRAAGSIPLFATTTPVQGTVHCHTNQTIINYNAAAVAMMKSQGIDVDDLFTEVFPIQGYLHGSMGIHFESQGYHFLGDEVSKFLNKY